MNNFGNKHKNEGVDGQRTVLLKNSYLEKRSKATREKRCNTASNLCVGANSEKWRCDKKAVDSANKSS